MSILTREDAFAGVRRKKRARAAIVITSDRSRSHPIRGCPPPRKQPRFLNRNASDEGLYRKVANKRAIFFSWRGQLRRFFEVARVLVRLDHVARFIINANRSGI